MQLQTAQALIAKGFHKQTQMPAVWVDLGSGSGLFTKALASFLPQGSTIYAVDKNQGIPSQHTERGIEIKSLILDFLKEDLPFNTLDGMLMANALHYVKDKETFLSKCKTYLKSDAPFLLIEYDTDIPVGHWVPYPATFDTLQKLFRTVGFSSCQKLGEVPSVYGEKMMYAALFSE